MFSILSLKRCDCLFLFLSFTMSLPLFDLLFRPLRCMRAVGKRGRAPALADLGFYQLFSFFEGVCSSGINSLGSESGGASDARTRRRSINAAPDSPRFQNSFSSFPFLHTYLVSVLRDQEFGVLV